MTDTATTGGVDLHAFDGVMCARCNAKRVAFLANERFLICTDCADTYHYYLGARRFRPDPPAPVKLATIEDIREALPKAVALCLSEGQTTAYYTDVAAYAHVNGVGHDPETATFLWLRDPAEGTA